jgi:hypothetical protein
MSRRRGPPGAACTTTLGSDSLASGKSPPQIESCAKASVLAGNHLWQRFRYAFDQLTTGKEESVMTLVLKMTE